MTKHIDTVMDSWYASGSSAVSLPINCCG